MRLDKILAHSGYGSRKQVKNYIRSGYVLVNGEVITDDDYKVNELEDEIIIADEEVQFENEVYYMLNKPKNCVSATYDENYLVVTDIIKEYKKSIFPVGRLDIDTTGLLVITNDGMLAHKLLSPKYHVDKTYHVWFDGTFKESYYKEFENGIILDDGYKTMKSKVELINEKEAYITIVEGKFHQVKRMFQALNMEVVELERISFGPLKLDSKLELGEYRKLTDEEIKALKK